MPIVPGLSDAKEPEAAPEAAYDLRIMSAEKKVSKKGSEMYECRIKIEDPEVDAPLIFHYVVLPNEGHEYYDLLVLNIRRFMQVFSLELEGDEFPEDGLEGATGHCLVGIEADDNGEDRNVLRLPRLSS